MKRPFTFFGTGRCSASVAVQLGESIEDATRKLLTHCEHYTFKIAVEVAPGARSSTLYPPDGVTE